MPGRRGRRPVRASVLAVALVSGLALSACFAATPPQTALGALLSLGMSPDMPDSFGGYNFNGHTTSTSATWTVPAETVGDPSFASTWVGATSAFGQFIQVGVQEGWYDGAAPSYQVFWSSTRKQFRPQFLGTVRPGDTVTASLVEDTHGWMVSLRGKGINDADQVADEAGAYMNEANWIQEDPAIGSSPDGPSLLQQEPYARPEALAFSGLRVDGRPPTSPSLSATALATADGTLLIPSPLRDDGFAFHGGSRAAWRYLRDASRFDQPLTLFESGVFSPTPPYATLVRAAPAFEAATTTFDRQLNRGPWPSRARPGALRLAACNESITAAVERFATATTRLQKARLSALVSVMESCDGDAIPVRAALGLPPPQ